MIDQLESRTLFSTTPHAALLVLRADVAGIDREIRTMINADNSAIANLNHDLSVFPTTATSDNAALRQLNFQFASQMSLLSNDFNNIKTLLGQDISQLINRCNAYNHHPNDIVGSVVQACQQLLTNQGSLASSTLSQDCNQMLGAYQQGLELVASTHPIDATLVTRISHISTTFATNVAAIKTAASTVAGTDISDFITALEPDGVVTPTTE